MPEKKGIWIITSEPASEEPTSDRKSGRGGYSYDDPVEDAAKIRQQHRQQNWVTAEDLKGNMNQFLEVLGEGYDSEKPQHKVTVQPFFMGKFQVTQAQWKAIASKDDLKVEIDLEPDASWFKGDDLPVEQVNWYDAVEFCQRLSKLTGRDYRLPSEAEWEYACRARTTTPFHFGETITGKLANYDASRTYANEPKGEYRQKTTPVGSFAPNPFGL